MDAGTARTILGEVNRLASGPLADSFAESDRNPPVYDPANRTVTMPSAFKDSYEVLMRSGWWRLHLPGDLGGMDAPPSLRWAVNELLLGE
jgi:alkylation response protein AidB-like acyl-CoA dehydrogenase